MTIEELKKERDELHRQLFILIHSFENKTGVRINSISLEVANRIRLDEKLITVGVYAKFDI